MPNSQSKPQAKDEARAVVPPPTRRSSATPPKTEKNVANTAPKKEAKPDAVDLLVDDHLAVDACFKKYEKMMDDKAPASQRRALAMEICKMLTVHTQIEEQVFYPAAREAGLESQMLDEAQIEHDSAKALIEQITAGNPDEDMYDAKVKVLGDVITHHVTEEHTELFPKSRKNKKMDLVAIADELAARKQALEASL